MSPSTSRTRLSQWKKYFEFCSAYSFNPLPADECLVCLYITHLTESLNYTSITNYISALWALHKVYGFKYPDPAGFLISSTLRGAKFELGNFTNQAHPMTISIMRRLFLALDMQNLDDLVFWMMLVAGFRGLMRKSNLCEVGYAVRLMDVEFCDWGVKLSVHKSKTITFGERVFIVPFSLIPCSCFCLDYYLRVYLSRVNHPSGESNLFSRYVQGRLVPASYNWFNGRLGKMCHDLGVPKLTSHSLRRGGAQALAQVGVPVEELKEIGDWRSWSVLLYLARPLRQRITLDQVNCHRLFAA